MAARTGTRERRAHLYVRRLRKSFRAETGGRLSASATLSERAAFEMVLESRWSAASLLQSETDVAQEKQNGEAWAVAGWVGSLSSTVQSQNLVHFFVTSTSTPRHLLELDVRFVQTNVALSRQKSRSKTRFVQTRNVDNGFVQTNARHILSGQRV